MKNSEFEIISLPQSMLGCAADAEKTSLGAEAWTAKGIEDTIKAGGHYFAAVNNGTYAGHIGFTAVLDEGYITNITVLPQYRRKGFAAALVEAAVRWGSENGLVFLSLEVRESNLAARELYEKEGFAAVGRRKSFYRNPPEDAVIMTRTF